MEAVLHLIHTVLHKICAVDTRQHAISAVFGTNALRSDFPSNFNVPWTSKLSVNSNKTHTQNKNIVYKQ